MFRTAGVSPEWVTWMLPGGSSLERMSAHGTRRLGNTWNAPWLTDDATLPDDLADELPEPDVGHLLRGGLVLNRRALDVLGPMLRRSGELLVCHTHTGRRWAINCTTLIEPGQAPPLGMYRVAGRPDLGVCAGEVFVRVVRSSGLTGLAFEHLEDLRTAA